MSSQSKEKLVSHYSYTLEQDDLGVSFCHGLTLSDLNKEQLGALHHLLEDPGRGQFINDLKTGLQVAVTASLKAQRICVVFRGSDDEFDWVNNIKTLKTCIDKTQDVSVHRGFMGILTRHIQDLMDCIDRLLGSHPLLDVYVTGHSLGGALATLFGYLLARSPAVEGRIGRVTVVSFASPRVGNAGWRRAFDSTQGLAHYRVVNNRDLITATPSLLYKHTGTVLHLTNSPTTHMKLYQDYHYSWSRFSMFTCWSVKDHNTSRYWRRLQQVHWIMRGESNDYVFLLKGGLELQEPEQAQGKGRGQGQGGLQEQEKGNTDGADSTSSP
ncbi:Alpha/Beta hydrolase protein [Ochromonadaceae sp. CCMP2298]|nr:Alpha/Beta hydrolase protein [Ochromonadaceae sp. CCMP2298]